MSKLQDVSQVKLSAPKLESSLVLSLQCLVFDSNPDRRALAENELKNHIEQLCELCRPQIPDQTLRAKPVSIPSNNNWERIEIRECGDPLVPIGIGSRHFPLCATDSRYFQEDPTHPNFIGHSIEPSLLTPFARTGLVKRLTEIAQSLWKEGKVLRIFDVYRQVETQAALRKAFDRDLALKTYFECQGISDPTTVPHPSPAQLARHADGYVARPSCETTKPSPHSTGGVADLWMMQLRPEAVALVELISQLSDQHRLPPPPSTFVGACLKELASSNLIFKSPEVSSIAKSELHAKILPTLTRDAMVQYVIRTFGDSLASGTDFDDFGPKSAANYYETHPPTTPEEEEARDNRRLLLNLAQYGRATEYWEVRLGDQVAAAQARNSGKDRKAVACYGAANLSASNCAFELARRAVWKTLPPMPYRT